MAKFWGGRFKKRIDPDFERFSASLEYDKRLLPYDLQINRAHVKALKKCGVLSAVEARKLLAAIVSLQTLYRQGRLKFDKNAEDVHSALHALLQARVGSLADKLHTARSRNDLVSQSTRLYCRENAETIYAMMTQLQKELVRKAVEYQEVLVPGMTHLQNAQVVSQAHIFLAYAEMFKRAKARFEGGRQFFDICVLGSGALAGTTFALDQKLIARELGLSHITDNSYDVSGDRDFVFNFLSCCFFTGLELSRIAEDLMIGQTRGFGLVDVDQAFCTGSSMMPQKKNADFLELVRGSAAAFGSNFTGMGLVLKGLPTSYNRDLQWDKKFLFDSSEQGQARGRARCHRRHHRRLQGTDRTGRPAGRAHGRVRLGDAPGPDRLLDHRNHRSQDQHAGVERDHRSGPRRRCRAQLRGRRRRSEKACP